MAPTSIEAAKTNIRHGRILRNGDFFQRLQNGSSRLARTSIKPQSKTTAVVSHHLTMRPVAKLQHSKKITST
jgi:hypothetical protein